MSLIWSSTSDGVELPEASAVTKLVNVLLSRQELGLFQWVLIFHVKRYDQKVIKGIKRDDQLWQNPEALQFYHTFFFFFSICGLEWFCFVSKGFSLALWIAYRTLALWFLCWIILRFNIILSSKCKLEALHCCCSQVLNFRIPHMAVTSGVWLDFKSWSQWIAHDNKPHSIVRSKAVLFLWIIGIGLEKQL